MQCFEVQQSGRISPPLWKDPLPSFIRMIRISRGRRRNRKGSLPPRSLGFILTKGPLKKRRHSSEANQATHMKGTLGSKSRMIFPKCKNVIILGVFYDVTTWIQHHVSRLAAGHYRGEKKGLQILLSYSQAWPGRKAKQGQEEVSRKHVPTMFLVSVVHISTLYESVLLLAFFH